MEVLPLGGGCVQFQIQIQFPFEIVPDVTDDFLFRCGGEAGDGDGLFVRFLFLQFPDEVADVKIIHPEVLPPGGEAVGLVDDEPDHVPGQQEFFHRPGPEGFRRQIQQIRYAAGHPFQRLRPLDIAQKPVDRHGVHNALFRQIVYLVLHEGLQGGDDHRQAVGGFARHDRRKLEGDGLPAAGGKHRQQGFPLHCRLCRPLL